MGEVNVVKQAIFPNGHRAVTELEIDQWHNFMAVLRSRDMPLTLHSDIGNTADPFKYLHLMHHILDRYPDNKVVWLHLGGLSKEISSFPGGAASHVAALEGALTGARICTLIWRGRSSGISN